MFKRLISFLLVLCLLMGGFSFPVSNGVAFAAEQDNSSGSAQASSPGNDLIAGQELPEGIEFPDNPSTVNMADLPSQSSHRMLSAARAVTTGNTPRYTVLVLDTSASSSFVDSNGSVFYTADTAIEHVKASAKKFIEAVTVADGTNYVAIVTYKGSNATVVSPFSTDLQALTLAVDGLSASQNTRSVASGLQTADGLIDEIPDPAALKNVVLFTTGMTNDGAYNYSGHYDENTIASNWRRTDTQVRLYAYANTAYEVARTLKNKASLYTIGLFNTMDDMPEQGRDIVQFFKLSALELAQSPEHFYDVKDPNQLAFAFGEVASNIVKKTGTFKYPGDGRDHSATYYYDDAYFYKSSYIYNEHLATMSLSFEMSAMASADVGDSYVNKSNNARNLLTDIGFTDFESNHWYTVKPTKDSIGAVAAHKSITDDGKNYTLIALAVRGAGYESEWASNFTIGESGQHQGFSNARDQVIDFLGDYISSHHIQGDIKLWITGFSRAAATANMVAGKIDEGGVSFPGATLALNDLYAYTFETPAGALVSDVSGTQFSNIFNIINPSDLVPKVAPATWSFTRYGIDKHIPSAETQSEAAYEGSLNKMKDRYASLEDVSEYAVDNFSMKKIKIDGWSALPGGDPLFSITDDTKNPQSQNAFLNSYITMLSKDYLISRTNYTARLQDGIRDICGLFFGASQPQSDKLIEVATEKFSSNWGWIAYELFKPFGGEDDAYKKVAQYLRESLDEAGITDYSQEEFDRSVQTLMDLVVALLLNHPNLATTLALNIGGIGQAHHPDLTLAWMQSMDSYYTPGGAVGFTSGKYRIVRINCPVDVQVYNEEGQMVASIINDVPQEVSSIVSAINEDGEKLVFLPASEDYNITITATGEDLMTYSINEYNPAAGEVNRLVNYYDIPIVTGQVLSGTVPAYNSSDITDTTEEASATSYPLTTGGKEVILGDDLSGEEATSAYFTVSAVANDSTLGLVKGSGTRQIGTFAQVEAVPFTNSEFLGWYKDDSTLVSQEAVYRFRVDEAADLTAKFARTVSSDANLATLSLGTEVSLTPSFESSITRYTARVSNSTATVTVSATSTDPRAAITGTGVKSLQVGENALTVTVTAEDGTTTKAYTVIVTRADGSGGGGSSPSVPSPSAPDSTKEPAVVNMPAPPSNVPNPPAEPAVVKGFTDVLESAWYYEDVMWASKNGIVSGVGNGRFSPVTAMTRAEFVAILARYHQADTGSYTTVSFTDVSADAWYLKYVGWAAANGIISGYGDGTFGADDILTREQMAAILYNMYNKPSVKGMSLPYTDKSHVSAWAIDAVTYWSNAGVLKGKEKGRFDPQGKFTRAEGAKVMHQLALYEGN